MSNGTERHKNSQSCISKMWKHKFVPINGVQEGKMKKRGSVPRWPWRAWKCSTLPVDGVEVFHAARGGHGIVPRWPWRAWKCSTLPVEGVEVFHAAHGGVWKCSMLPIEGVEVFKAVHGRCGSVPHCLWRAWKCSTLPVEGMEVL